MSLLERMKLLLQEHRIIPNKLLGQNFMIEQSMFRTLAECASLNQNDTVLDVGAGFGFLTRFLASKCKRIVAIEADSRLVGILRERLSDLSNVEIIRGNVLEVTVPRFNKVVSIPPYQISSRLLLWLFSRSFDCAVLIFQKEFTDRLVAPAGSEDYGWLTVLTHYKANCELLDGVPKDWFFPQPEVGSIIVRLTPKAATLSKLKDELLFEKLVRSLFAQRNRKVRNAIKPFLTGVLGRTEEDAVRTVGTIIFGGKRVRELSAEDFGVLANAFAQ